MNQRLISWLGINFSKYAVSDQIIIFFPFSAGVHNIYYR